MGRRRTVGYIQNEWTCPNCQTRNKGSVKTCENCGAPQPENVQFELPAEQKFVTDEKSINAAKAGADIHCPFCGTRNPATAKTCSQCGGDLIEGERGVFDQPDGGRFRHEQGLGHNVSFAVRGSFAHVPRAKRGSWNDGYIGGRRGGRNRFPAPLAGGPRQS